VTRAIEEPMRWIATNAGHEGLDCRAAVREMKKDDEGFNALTDTYEIWSGGRHRPGEVVRSALQNASSIASLL
jgi:chaperonin GroEL